jgi:homoserine dehydrogenase
MKALRLAIAGLGTVGAGVVHALAERRAEIGERAGCRFELAGVSARDKAKHRDCNLEGIPWTDDPVSLASGDADVIVELIGGDDGPAYALCKAALAAKKHVVTANKALLAAHGAELAALAESNRVGLRFEASAAGGIPIVKALRESFIGHDVHAVRGILNGTCNYILTEMESTGMSFADVLAEAQRLGFAEADPSLDLGGGDTAHKLAILSSLAFGVKPDLAHMSVEGIERITYEDIEFAREFGYRIKLLGIARRTPMGLDQRVQPAMVKRGTPLGDVEGAFNAVVADVGAAGPFFFEGRGAGRDPTASAVIADLVDIARGASGAAFGIPAAALKDVKPPAPESRRSAFYLRFTVLDEPGVLAEIARRLADSHVSIESMIQRGRAPGEPVSIVMITHDAPQPHVANALKTIAASDKVLGEPSMIPMEAG